MKFCKLYLRFLFLFGISFSFALNSNSIQLPPPQTEIGKPLMQALKLRQSSRSFENTALPIQELSNLLWAAYGINRPEIGKRTAPSAINWQEMDIYVALKEGTFVYEAQSHSLTSVNPKDVREATGKQSFVADERRMSRAGSEDKMRWSSVDAGFIAQNVYLYCASQGLAVVVRGMVDRENLAKELKLQPEQKIVLCQTVGYLKQ